jgi:hypothetical protein
MKMDKQQQVLEMAKDICRVKHICNDVCKPISACDALRYAERAVEAGYIKVVRCKDCVWWEPRTFGSTIGRCENPRNGLVNEYSDDTDFCSYAEMKGGTE